MLVEFENFKLDCTQAETGTDELCGLLLTVCVLVWMCVVACVCLIGPAGMAWCHAVGFPVKQRFRLDAA